MIKYYSTIWKSEICRIELETIIFSDLTHIPKDEMVFLFLFVDVSSQVLDLCVSTQIRRG